MSVCDGYVSNPYHILWGAAKPGYPKFECSKCKELHSMCSTVNGYFICGQVDGHEGKHHSVSWRYEFENSDDTPVDLTRQ